MITVDDPATPVEMPATSQGGSLSAVVPSCFLCEDNDRCALPVLEGVVLSVVVFTLPAPDLALDRKVTPAWAGRMEIQTSLGQQSILVGIYWRNLLAQMAALLNQQDSASRSTGVSLVVRALHLDVDQTSGAISTRVTSLLILEPDRLVDVTALDGTDYCLRQWLADRLTMSGQSEAMIRGNIVHACFSYLVDQHAAPEMDATTALPAALATQTLPLGLLECSAEEMDAAVRPHVHLLNLWYTAEGRHYLNGPDRHPRSETLLLCPELGLRGRIDLLVQGADGVVGVLELKTGKANLNYPAPQFQVHGYGAILRAQGRAAHGLEATVIYTGGLTYDTHRVDFSFESLRHVVTNRNQVILAEWWDIVPATGRPQQCSRARGRDACHSLSDLLALGTCQGHAQTTQPASIEVHSEAILQHDRLFYGQYYRLLRMEEHEHHETLRALWRATPADRIAQGAAVAIAQNRSRIDDQSNVTIQRAGHWLYDLACHNTSDLRVGDSILLSDGDPIRGEVVTGKVEIAGPDRLVVSTREPVATPRLVDRYDSNRHINSTLRALSAWMSVAESEREAVYGLRAPTFDPPRPLELGGLNASQKQAIELALRARDYLLIQGPPGTGKTTVLAQIVVEFLATGKRVILGAWTNAAVDNMLLALRAFGCDHFVRLGPAGSVSPELRPYHILTPVSESVDEAGDDCATTAGLQPEDVILRVNATPILAATIATWADGAYSRERLGNRDVVIIDEAGQVTVPAVLGALRLASTFILVGDDRQLPAVVSSPDALAGGLARSLFEDLRPIAAQHGALIQLTEQYRMNEVLCSFPSTQFYEGALVAHSSVATRTLRAASTRLLDWRPAIPPTLARLLDPDKPLVVLDVPHHAPDMAHQPVPVVSVVHDSLETTTLASGIAVRQSSSEARAVVLLLRGLLRMGLPPAEIGVITPFRAQVALIRRELERANLASDTESSQGIVVDTVDRFQGGQREVMLISLAGVAREARRGRTDFLDDARRFNVALTRARSKLIILGDLAALENVSLLRRLIDHHRRLYGRPIVCRWRW